MPKIQPAIRRLVYPIPADGTYDIDIAKDLSAINRRLYRQGMQYMIQDVSFAFAPTSTVGSIICMVSTAGDTWMVHNAWKKGFELWKNQQNEVDSAFSGHIQGKWADFKVELWDGSSTLLNTIASDNGAIAPDEWNLSNYVWDDDGNEVSPTFCLLGSSDIATKIGLVQEYHISRNQTGSSGGEPLLPSEASDSIYAKSLGTDEMSDKLLDVVESDNDLPPYDANEMHGGDTLADTPPITALAIANANVGIAHTGPFMAECGLLAVSFNTFQADGSAGDLSNLDTDPEILLFVDVAVGPYKGVMAEPMGQ